MGQEQSAVPIHDADSEICPGFKCIVTAPLDEFCDYDRLWMEMSAGLRTDFAKDPNLKSGEVEDISETQFTVKKVFDGEKLKVPGGADFDVKTHYKMDKSRGEIYEEYREDKMNALASIRVTRILREPLRMEAWRQNVANWERRSGMIVAANAGTFLKAVLKREVTVLPNQPSKVLQFPGVLSAMSEELQDTNFDDLWEGMLEQFKTLTYNPFATNVKLGSVVQTDGPGVTFEVAYHQDGQKMSEAMSEAGVGKIPDEDNIFVVEANKATRTITVRNCDAASHAIRTITYTVIHSDPHPLAVESWMHLGDSPGVDEVQRSLLTGYVKLLMDRVAPP